ncbi:CHASE2 domain-containing protein [Thalassospiraceae bacterium LMO-JJ14]|nr:CHASE2 domain-containing protein [Thalassospiraceae bacterium LMO-JJ14]
MTRGTFRSLVTNRLHIAGMIGLLLALYALGVVPGIDRALADLRYLLFPREASGKVVIVQIDSKSLQQLGEWPWSRSLHAEAINKLSKAGVSRIGLDIDFSSPSRGNADNDLIEAVSNAQARIVLPVFKQWSSTRGGEVTTTTPMHDLAEKALLGSVNVTPASDGLVRKYDRLHKWHESFVPAFATELLGRTTEGTESFYVDYSIRPESIPRVSFVDLLSGQFNADLLKGKYVIIGATALELGDEIAVPVYGALSGPELQAMSAESILLGRTIMQADTLVVLGAALLIGILLSGMFVRLPHVRGSIAFIVTSTLLVTLAMILQTYVPVDIPAGSALVTTAYCFVYGLTKQLDMQALLVFKRSAEIRERRALNQAIADNSFTGIVVADHAGIIRFVNKAAAEMLNVSRDEIIDRDVAKVILPDDDDVSFDEPTPHHSKIYTSLKVSGDVSLPVEIAISNVSITPESAPFERRTTNRDFTIYAISDISVYKQTEDVLNRAAEQAIEANRAKSEFIANMSHELRTPLNAILGFSETIKSEIFGPVGSMKYKAYADDIFTSGSHLLSIINDLLEVSRLAAGKTEIHASAVDFNEIVDECMRIAGGYPGASLLDITTNVDERIETLWTDARIVKQIVLNLLSNAIKFTPENGKVSLSVNLTREGGMEVVVEDNGIGIPTDQIERVMEPFHQLESSMRRSYHGSGLGLHLVKSQVVLLGGTLHIESKIRVGTRISIVFPPENTVTAGKIVQIDRA